MKINVKVLPLFIAFLLEVLFYSVCKNYLPAKINPLFNSALSIFIVVYAWKLWQQKDLEEASFILLSKNNLTFLKITTVVLALLVLIYFSVFFKSEPIDIKRSDIIPVIQQYYLDRLFNGEFVYTSVDRGTYQWTPNYFPMHWLPFTISNFLHFDHRLLALGALILVIIYYSFKIINKSQSISDALVKLILPYTIIFFMRYDNKIILGHCVETLICSYYFLFSINIFKGNTFAKSLGLSSILLSRFSIVLWTPFYIVSSFLKEKRATIFLCIYSIVFALTLFIIPFLLKDPTIVFKGFEGFTDVYLLEWKGQSWQAPGDNPYQLFNGLGFANYFYSFWPGELVNKIHAIVSVQLLANILVPVLSFLFMKRFSRNTGIERYQLLTLKICLLAFYAFIVVPYQYLFMVPLFVSVSIVSQFNLFLNCAMKQST